jgi:rhodanese-related sulfurtransferase
MTPWLLLFVAVLLLAIGLAFAFMILRPAPTPLDIAAARAGLKSRQIQVAVDVRTPAEWTSGHYAKALHIPVGQIFKQLPVAVPDRTTTILFYCRSGRRAYTAAAAAQELGYSRVYYLADSIDVDPSTDLEPQYNILNV